MNFEQPPQEPNQEEQAGKPKSPLLNMRDTVREHSTEMRNNVAEIQAARYEIALQLLMERSGENADLVNALNSFVKALETISNRGSTNEQMLPTHVEQITKFFNEKTEELSNWTLSGNNRPEKDRPSFLKG
jgi:flagellar biosynthesis chaperone FliJ